MFGPADAPWYQGEVESMVKGVKRAIKFAVNNQRLSASEFLTVCSEVSNLLNERPLELSQALIPSSTSSLLTVCYWVELQERILVAGNLKEIILEIVIT